MTLISRHSRKSVFLLSSLLAAGLSAQTAAETATAKNDEDEVIKLSPFSVTTEKDSGYRASNSIAGTRTNTPIKDIALNIQVFTKDLADDLMLTDQTSLERYNAALVNGGADVHSENNIQQAYNGFLFRGFVQNWGLRDGVREYDPVDAQGLARVEIVKGPAAALYGVTYSGGVMNSVTKEVDMSRNFTQLRLSAYSEGGWRGAMDVNYSGKSKLGKVGVRFNAARAQTEDHREHSEGMVRYTQTNFNWQPAPGTEIKFLVEDGFRQKPNGLGYFTRPGPTANGSDIPLQIDHPQIPWTWNWSTNNMRSADNTLARAVFNQAFGEHVNFNAYIQSASRVQVDSEGWDAAGGGGSNASWDMGFSGNRGGNTTGWMNAGDGNLANDYIRTHYHHRDWQNKTHAYGANLVGKFDIAAVKNTVTIGGASWAEKFNTYKGTQPGGSTNFFDMPIATGINTTPVFGPPDDYFMDVAGAYDREETGNEYFYANWQLGLFQNRLKLQAAMNHTKVDRKKWANGLALVPTTNNSKKNSPMYSVMYDVTKSVSVFFVHGTSLFPTTDKNDFEQQLPDVVGENNEFGVKFELLNGKISGTASYYMIKQDGGSQRDPNANNRNRLRWDSLSPADRAIVFPGITDRSQLNDRQNQPGDLVAGGEQESKGFEADVVFQPTRSLQMVLSYANVDQEVTSAINRATIGQSTSGLIKQQVALLTKYTFLEGALKDVSLGLGLQAADKQLRDYQTFNGATVARYHPKTNYAEFFAGYKFKVFGYDNIVQLNVKNLTEQDEFVGWQETPAGVLATKPYEVPTKMRFSITWGMDF